jgi:FMN phosphatase YigB (HAD superfamily)
MEIPSQIAVNIEAIFFDMNGTLREREPHDPTQLAATRRLLDLLEKEDVPETFWEELTRRFKAYGLWAQEKQTQLSEREIWTRWILPEFPAGQVGAVAAELTLAWNGRKGRPIPKQDAKETLAELKRRGYRLGVISNSLSTLDIPRSLEAFGWNHLFDVVVLSAQVKWRKPAIEIYHAATRRLKLKPSRCAFVGNRFNKDIVGSKQAGFGLGILVTARDGLVAEYQGSPVMPDLAVRKLGDLLQVFPAKQQAYSRSEYSSVVS